MKAVAGLDSAMLVQVVVISAAIFRAGHGGMAAFATLPKRAAHRSRQIPTQILLPVPVTAEAGQSRYGVIMNWQCAYPKQPRCLLRQPVTNGAICVALFTDGAHSKRSVVC